MYNTTVYYSKDASPELFLNLKKKTLFIFDQDGTLYLGNRPFDFAVGFINRLREAGKRVLFFTNNASHNPVYYVDKLSRLGFSPQDGELMTSGDVTIQFLLRHRPGKTVYLVGTPQLEKQFSEAGIILTDDADIVVSSFDTTLTYKSLRRLPAYPGRRRISVHSSRFQLPDGRRIHPRQRRNFRFYNRLDRGYSDIFRQAYKETA